MKTELKIALGQMEVIPNRPRKNVDTMLHMMDHAREMGVHLIAFPEMCVGGYLLSDKWLTDDFCLDLMAYHETLLEASNGLALAFGNVHLDKEVNERTGSDSFHPNEDGRTRKYNAVYVIQDGQYAPRTKENHILPPGVQPKVLLPNYRVFDDERYFLSAKDIAADFDLSLEDLLQPFRIRVGEEERLIGFELCEDLWCNDYRRALAALNPTKILIQNEAECVVNISASPWTYGKNRARDRRVLFIREDCGEHSAPFFYVNCVGVQNNGKNILTYDGGSTAYNKEGRPFRLSEKAYQQELIAVQEREWDGTSLARKEQSKIAQKHQALLEAIRHFRETMGAEEHPRFLLGLSGGVDSSVAAALLVEAVGPEKVYGVNMPTRFNRDATKKAARHAAKALGIHYAVIPIQPLVEANAERLEAVDLEGTGHSLSALNLENIQAKIRGTAILSNLAAKLGGIFVNTGNKLEIALGYTTLYGDTGGAFSVLGDLTKVEVFALARHLNENVWGREVIPWELLPDDLCRFPEEGIPPSAELRETQVDPMKFGYHDALLDAFTDYRKKTPEDILRWYVEGRLAEELEMDPRLLTRWGLEDPIVFVQDLEWFCRLIDTNVFKRIQSPPIIVTSKSAFGFDIRESLLPHRMSEAYRNLKNRLLKSDSFRKGDFVNEEK